eukprot:Rhum_TRINITY_DN15025_c0_g2::Rhum_TRINITY_DN15025_c0_g2_i3::g.134073::m.134073
MGDEGRGQARGEGGGAEGGEGGADARVADLHGSAVCDERILPAPAYAEPRSRAVDEGPLRRPAEEACPRRRATRVGIERVRRSRHDAGTGFAGMLPVEAPTVTNISQSMQKRGRESTGATPRAKRVRASSPRTPAPAGVLQLHQTPEEHSSQALSAQARAVYKMLEVGDFTFDHDFDNEDDYIHEPLIELRQRCAQTLENGVSEYISRFAHDLIPVRRRSMVKFCFAAEYTSARGAQCVHESVPDMVVFRRTDELPIKELRTEKLLASTCRQHKPLLIEVQSGSRTLEESKVRLVTTLFSFVKHTGADVDAECVYGIVVEESLERIHVARFKSGKYELDGSFPARCLVDICRKVLCGSAEEDTQHTLPPSVFQQRATIPKHTHTRAPPICPQHHVLAP